MRRLPAVSTLTTVIIIGFILLSVVIAVTLQGINAVRVSENTTLAVQNHALIDACAEYSLELIRTTTSYTGSGNLNLNEGQCAYTVANTGAAGGGGFGTFNKTITLVGTVEGATFNAQITTATISPQITIASWNYN